MNDFEIVTMEDASSPEPAPPEVASAPKGRSYEEVINDDTKAEVFSQNGVCYYIKNLVPNKDITQAMLKHGGCVECYTRAKKFCGLLDKNCQPVFLKNVRSKEDGWSDDTELGSFFNVREKCIEVNKNKTNVKFHLVEGGSFPSVNKGEDENGNPFQHVTIFPDKVTSAENVRKYKRILNEINVIQPRMEKICCIDAYDSVKILAKELYRLERPDHWRSVINWITDIQNRWLKCKRYGGPLNFEKWGRIPKIHLCVFALTTGRIEQDENTAVHKDYKQSLQIVELIESGMGIEGILSAMDERTHPDNYMVSQLARNMAKHKVTSKYSISLVWPGEFHDDLDLHLIWYRLVNGRREKISEIYYGGKISIYHFNGNRYETRLDFDANVNGGSAEPAENITCVPFGEYDILVNNFTRRTKHKIIPFTIIIHQEGKQKEIIENWTKRIIAHPKKWDQALLRETMAEFKPPPGLTLGLPVTKWSNGHIYFVQPVVTDPIMVHNTFQYGGSIGKDWRFMESGLWSLPYPYDDKPREYMTYHPKYPEIGQVKPIPHKNAKEWVIKTHMTYMEPQLRQFEAALNLARLKNRVLILPQFKCLYDRVWFPHPGRFPGSAAFPLPYICPTDHILKIWEPNIERDKIRPYGFQPKKGDVEIVTVDQLKTKPTEIFRKRWTHPWCCTEDGIIEYNIQNF